MFNGNNNENGDSFIPESPQEPSISDICSMTPDKLEDINILGEITNTNVVSTSEIEETRNNTIAQTLPELHDDDDEINSDPRIDLPSLSLKGSKSSMKRKRSFVEKHPMLDVCVCKKNALHCSTFLFVKIYIQNTGHCCTRNKEIGYLRKRH